ncbi:uncharacterized protein PITG_19764 [Phytophthora infestans T30-4]|uniref:Uncharacterized protein n=1 Tax=Phytophthora infestans (strain T30-4) TaxID=403677 RepID=D0P106_PHYIT|nr:uncharacterized protein PITG_19764 [Phytophthora infestans T30-4]EEY53718.1 conserved hypothetical protein [Phytophthora infestans T30-4]|eukprot:XP_002896005.1 conserved hypothetical protein [Phytophthora infestans T30-4]
MYHSTRLDVKVDDLKVLIAAMLALGCSKGFDKKDLLRDVDGEDDLALQEPAPMGYFSPLSSDVVVQAVLDLASSADNEDASERSRETNENEAAIPTEEEQLKSSQKLIQNEEKVVNDAEEHELPVQVEARDDEADTEVDESLDVAVVSTPNTDFGQNEAMDTEVESPEMLPPPQVQEEVNEALKIALPPPAPTCVPVIVGSINTVEDDNDDSDDSQDEDEGETSQLRPPLQLGGPEDDDEDVLEVDATLSRMNENLRRRWSLQATFPFSVATTGASPSKTIGTAEDDEFAFDVNLENDLSVLSEVSIKARRESLEVKKRKEEEELLKELKRATDEEKKLNESDQAMDSTQPDATAYKDADALSLAELHSIYKRGLGDQEVLMDEEKKNKEADDEDSEGEEKAHNDGREASVACDNAPDTKATSEKRDVDESAEWREIKLVQHRQSQSANAGDSPETAIVSYTEAAKYYAETPDVMQHRDIIVSEDFSRGSYRGRSNPIKVIGEAFDGDSLRPSRPAEVIVPSKLKASDRKVLDNNLEFTEIGLQAVDEKE